MSNDLPALAPGAWSSLTGESPDTIRQYRGILLAHAEAFENEQLVVTASEGGECVAITGALELHRENSPPILTVFLPAVFGAALWRSLLVRDGVERMRPMPDIVDALVELARQRGLHRLVVPYCPAADTELRSALTNLGFREMPAPPQHGISLTEPHSLERYLARLGGKDRWEFRRDLKRAHEAGARIVSEGPVSEATARQTWPLVADLFQRKGSGYIPRGHGLFSAMREHLAPADLSIDSCLVGDELVGCVAYHHSGASTRFAYAGHRPDLPWKVHMALVATFLAREIERGATDIRMGFTNDAHKRRLGATAQPHVHYLKATG
ncbi:MAG: hypothetical protein ABI321_22205 [Polyangia bacterium]